MKIDRKRWEQAQISEISHHRFSNIDIEKYKNYYETLFNFLGKEESRDSVVEVGPAFHPALCYNEVKNKIVVEPMFDSFPDTVKNYYYQNRIAVIRKQFEEIEEKDIEMLASNSREVWLFNVLQHVQDPDLIVNKCKEYFTVIKFFEPINTPIDTCHPHTFDLEWFKQHFGDCTNLYTGTNKEFHKAHCAYGKYRRQD